MGQGLYRRIADRRSIFAAPIIGVIAILAGAAQAATFVVSSAADNGSGTLRQAIIDANASSDNSSSITFAAALGGATITLLSTLSAISQNLTISGPTTSPGITISGGGAVRLMQVDSGATLNLQFLTMADGSVTGCSTVGGGAISNQGTLTITNSTFSGNQTTGGDCLGGAVAGEFGVLTITNSTFSGNRANSGGAIYDDLGTLTITNSTFSRNQANLLPSGGGFGGAIFEDQGSLTITNSTFLGNQAGAVGGGGAIANLATASLKGTILAASTNGNCSSNVPFLADAGYNIADDGTCNFTMSTSEVTLTGDIGLDPAGLANNGGPTQTIALLLGGLANTFIPVADCTDQSSPTPQRLTTDQRGFARPAPSHPSACSAGAYEFGAFAGVPGRANCRGKTLSALAAQFGSLDAAAKALAVPNAAVLQASVRAFCR